MNRTPLNSIPIHLMEIFDESCQRSNPEEHTAKSLGRATEGLHIGDRVYSGNIGVSIIACGKAAASQARAVILWAGTQFKRALIITPDSVGGAWGERVEFHVATHPKPSSLSERAASAAFAFVGSIPSDELLVCAISGGASSLMAAPRPPLELEDKTRVTDALLSSGADIRSVNIIRQQLSMIKGGGLTCQVSGAVETIIYSDIETKSLDLIGSGPTIVHGRKSEEISTEWLSVRPRLNLATGLLEKCDALIAAEKRQGTRTILNPPIVCASPETLKTIATEICRERGFSIYPTPSATYGNEVGDVVSEIIQTVQKMKARCTQKGEPQLAIWVREPVLKVSRMGNGGRNSHLALLVAQAVQGSSGVAFLAAGSDGVDGNSKCAGAVVTSHSWSEGISLGLNPKKLLSQFDSAEFHEKIGGAVVTGPTGTNLTDLHLLWVEP